MHGWANARTHKKNTSKLHMYVCVNIITFICLFAYIHMHKRRKYTRACTKIILYTRKHPTCIYTRVCTSTTHTAWMYVYDCHKPQVMMLHTHLTHKSKIRIHICILVRVGVDGEDMVGRDGGRIAIRIPSPETNMSLCLVCDDIIQ